MARTYTRSELRTRLEQLCDIENDAHISSSEKNAILDSAAAETMDKIIENGIHQKYVTSATFNTVAGTTEYNLSSVAGSNFYRLTGLYVVENGDQLRALQSVGPAEIQSFRPPQAVVPMKVYFIPFHTKTTSDSDTFDGINGWEEHLLMTAACAVKMKREEDYGLFYRRKKELEDRMSRLGQVDFAEPARVQRKYRRRMYPWVSYSNTVNAYSVRGDKLELFQLSGYTAP